MEVRQQIGENIERIKKNSPADCSIRCFIIIIPVALDNDFTKPEITNEDIIEITDGRHPVVEELTTETFVPNDTLLNRSDHPIYYYYRPQYVRKIYLYAAGSFNCFTGANW